jgi:hypothetical protein
MIYEIEKLRKREIQELDSSLGGKYGWMERIKRGGIGSPFMYYAGGWKAMDELDDKSSESIRVNIEELKEGFYFRFSERTRTYFAPILKKDIVRVSVQDSESKIFLTFHFKELKPLTTWIHNSRKKEISIYLKNSAIGQN